MHNTDINNLYYNNKKIKYAYFNGEKVWTQKHIVRWYDNLGNLLKTEWVIDGESATPPNVTEFNAEFYGYLLSGWDSDYSAITSDKDIIATTTIETAYLFKNGYGVNADFYEISGETCTAYDNTSSTSYTSISKGSINDDRIYCSHKGATGSSNALFRSIRYIVFPTLNMETINNQGYTKLKVSGTYIFTSGNVYREANLRVAFVSLQTTTKVTTNTSTGVNGTYKHQVRLNKSTTSSTSVTASSGAFNGEITLPTTGDYYLIIGELSKAFSGTTSITINNIWLE